MTTRPVRGVPCVSGSRANALDHVRALLTVRPGRFSKVAGPAPASRDHFAGTRRSRNRRSEPFDRLRIRDRAGHSIATREEHGNGAHLDGRMTKAPAGNLRLRSLNVYFPNVR